jgi:hypothetical protein
MKIKKKKIIMKIIQILKSNKYKENYKKNMKNHSLLKSLVNFIYLKRIYLNIIDIIKILRITINIYNDHDEFLILNGRDDDEVPINHIPPHLIRDALQLILNQIVQLHQNNIVPPVPVDNISEQIIF